MEQRVSTLEEQSQDTRIRLTRIETQMESFNDNMVDVRSRLTALESRVVQVGIGIIGTMIAGYTTLFVAVLLKGGS